MTSAATICMINRRAIPRMTTAIVETVRRMVGRAATIAISDSETVTATAEMVKETDASALTDFIHAWTERATLFITDNAWSRHSQEPPPVRVHGVSEFMDRHNIRRLDTVAQMLTYSGMIGPKRTRRPACTNNWNR